MIIINTTPHTSLCNLFEEQNIFFDYDDSTNSLSFSYPSISEDQLIAIVKNLHSHETLETPKDLDKGTLTVIAQNLSRSASLRPHPDTDTEKLTVLNWCITI